MARYVFINAVNDDLGLWRWFWVSPGTAHLTAHFKVTCHAAASEMVRLKIAGWLTKLMRVNSSTPGCSCESCLKTENLLLEYTSRVNETFLRHVPEVTNSPPLPSNRFHREKKGASEVVGFKTFTNISVPFQDYILSSISQWHKALGCINA